MREFVAVKDVFVIYGNPSMKREALIFDRIAVPNYRYNFGYGKAKANVEHSFIDELDGLFERGIIFEPDTAPYLETALDTDEAKEYLRQTRSFGKRLQTSIPGIQNSPTEVIHSAILASEYLSRLVSLELSESHDMDAHPVLLLGSPLTKNRAVRSDVLHLVLNALPMPCDSVPWERIIEFRQDPDSKYKFSNLRNWMNDVVHARLSPVEVEQKLEWLIGEYRTHLKLHEIKIKNQRVEAILSRAEAVEELFRLKPIKAVKALWSIKRNSLELMERELQLPGREVAYLFSASKAFSGRGI